MAVAITRPTLDIPGVAASSNVATYTTDGSGSLPIGSASSDRIIVVGVGAEATSLTGISGVTYNQGGSDIAMTAGSQGLLGVVVARLFWASVPTGTTLTNVKVTFTGASPGSGENHIAIYAVTGGGINLIPGQNSSTDMDATSPLTTGSITVRTGGGFIGVGAGATDTVGKTWAGNATEDLDVDAGTMRFMSATGTTAGVTTITCTGGTNGEDGALSYAVILPTPTNFGDLVGVSNQAIANIGASNSPTSAITVSVGDLIFVNFAEQISLTASNCTDNLGNSYTALNTFSNATNASLAAYYSICTNAGACTPSVTATAGTDDCAILCAAYKGSFAASPVDVNTTARLDTAGEPYDTNATGTLSQADELIIGYFGSFAQETGYDTPGPAGAILDTFVLGAGNCGAALTSLLVSATTSITMSIQGLQGARSTSCCSVAFKKAVAAADNNVLRYDLIKPNLVITRLIKGLAR